MPPATGVGGDPSPSAAVHVAAHVSKLHYDVVQNQLDFYPGSALCGGTERTATGDGANVRPRAKKRKGRAVRFKGIPGPVNDLTESRPSVAKPAGDTRLLREFHDTQMTLTPSSHYVMQKPLQYPWALAAVSGGLYFGLPKTP
jgi:hypothetical protein